MIQTLPQTLPLLAQESGGGGGMGMFIPMILILVLFYFVLIRPQRQQQKRQEQMRSSLRVGDKVITIGGIHGLITGRTERTVSVKVAEGLSLKFDRSAIATVTESRDRHDDDDEEEDEESEEGGSR